MKFPYHSKSIGLHVSDIQNFTMCVYIELRTSYLLIQHFFIMYKISAKPCSFKSTKTYLFSYYFLPPTILIVNSFLFNDYIKTPLFKFETTNYRFLEIKFHSHNNIWRQNQRGHGNPNLINTQKLFNPKKNGLPSDFSLLKKAIFFWKTFHTFF